MKQYNGWLLSNNIIKRSVAVFGHFMLGYILVGLAISIPVIIIGLIFG